MFHKQAFVSTCALAALLLLGCFSTALGAFPQSASAQRADQSKSGASTAPSASTAKPAGPPSRNQPAQLPRRAVAYYESLWGVDSFTVKWAESGELVRFSYRVINADKAMPLHDKEAQPQLIDPQAGVSLVVPTMEKVGQLRQSSTPEVGRFYWMAFSNQGRRVKRGDRVTVVIGKFHVDGLEVQ